MIGPLIFAAALGMAALSKPAPVTCPEPFRDSFRYDMQGRFAVSKAVPVKRPTALFKKFDATKFIVEENEPDCRDAIVRQRYLEFETGNVFTAWFSNEDKCDGGNSYGLLVRGESASAREVICTMEDSTFYTPGENGLEQ